MNKRALGVGVNIHVLALLFVTLVWGATFPVLKAATAHLSGVEVSALRFLIAAFCMAPLALRVPRRTWLDGGLLGALVLVSYVLQAFGLQFISSNRSAFLTSLNVLMVPLLGVVFGTRLTLSVMGAATLACAGIGLMSWEGGSNLMADVATVLGALAYALYVIVLSQRAARHMPRQLAATQIVWMALLGSLWMLVDAWGTDKLQTLPGRLDLSVWAGLAYLGIVATAGMLFLQAMAQRHVSADKAALVYAMEPVFAALFAWMWLAEGLTWTAALGGAMVVVAVVLSEWSASGNAPSKAAA
ncbi:MAG: DMT family transporter [Rhodoferax sp.]|nr:DMT family transporter [Rhodoferax sp.]MDP3650708.1 DMT family transporter [Rhodoferax sp.]